MFIGKFRLVPIILLSLIMVFTLGVASACTPAQAQQLEGILKNVDAISGNITIVTKDGKTVTLTIPADASIAVGGATSNITTLEPGATIKIEIDKEGKVARHIEARQAEVEGTIINVASGNITIQTEKSRQVSVQVTSDTRIRVDKNQNGTLADLQVGVAVQVVYDPVTNLAVKVKVEKGENEGKGNSNETSKVGWGILEVRVTDPPPANVKSAIVHFSKIEVHKASGKDSDNTSDNGSSWIPVIGAPSSFDLMSIIGVEQILGSANITAGSFTQIRMNVTEVTGVTTDNVSYTAEVPSGELKIVGAFKVGGGNKTVLTLDFDGEKSLIQTGNGQFLFNPVVKLLVNNEGTGSVDNRGESNRGQSGENEGKGNSGNSDNSTNSGKKD